MEIRLKLMCSVILLSLSSVCGSSGAEWPSSRHGDFGYTTMVDSSNDSGSDSEVDSSEIIIQIQDDNYKELERKIDLLVQSNDKFEYKMIVLAEKVNKKLNSIYDYITDPCNHQTTQPVLLDPHQMCVIENFIAAIGGENKLLENCLGMVNKIDQPAPQMCDRCNKLRNGNGRCSNHHGGCNTDTRPRRCVRDVQQDKRKVTYEPNKQHCHQLETRQDGIYEFGSPDEVCNEAGRLFQEQYCEFDDAGNAWTVIQRRSVNDHNDNFNRSWAEYKDGFGELDKEFWFGNDFIHKLTWDEDMELLIVLEDDTGGRQWVEYSEFQIADEGDNYNVIIKGHRSTIRDTFLIGNDQDFSTYDRPNDKNVISCAETMGMGWWFDICTDEFASNYMGMKTVKMMVRPKGLRSGKSNDIDDVSNTDNSF